MAPTPIHPGEALADDLEADARPTAHARPAQCFAAMRYNRFAVARYSASPTSAGGE